MGLSLRQAPQEVVKLFVCVGLFLYLIIIRYFAN